MNTAQDEAPKGNLTRVYAPRDEGPRPDPRNRCRQRFLGSGLGPVNVIAVHGMNTESPATWRAFRNHRDSNDGYVDWLADADMLPNMIPSSPIWTFHYNTSWQSDAPFERLHNLADKLLLSLDSILFQRPLALVRAKGTQSRFLHILRATIGVMFLGSPLRRGPALTSLGRSAVALRSVLQQLLEDFSATVIMKELRVQIWCFYELKRTKKRGFLDFVVNRDAACIDGHPSIGLDANHTMMNKFFGPHDKNYELVSAEIRDVVENYMSTIDQSLTGYESDEHRKCHQAFKTSSYEEYKNITPDRVPGTCMWVLEDPKYNDWRQNQRDDLLWLSADPGCGKTVLSKSLIDNELCDTDTSLTCYFFFKDNEEQNSISTALCALLHQLFAKKPRLLRHAMKSWEQNGSKLQQETHALWQIFIAATTDPIAGNVTCVLDALDECKEIEARRLIRFLNQFYTSSFQGTQRSSQLKFIVTSRPYDEIARSFRGIPDDLPTIRLFGERENDKISLEINRVIHVRVQEISKELGLEEDAQSTLKEKLLSITHRTYLWLHLVIEEVRSSLERTPKGIIGIIASIPNTVEDVYEMLLNRNKKNPRKVEHARKLLHIILAARRPLLLKELDVAYHIATEYPVGSYNELHLDEKHFEDKVRNLCGPFVFVNDLRVYLIHQTAKEFLVGKGLPIEAGCNWKHSLEECYSEKVMAEICIYYILFKDFDGPHAIKDKKIKHNKRKEVDFLPEVRPEFSFIGYAAMHWASHFRRAAAEEQDRLLESNLMLCNPESRRAQLWYSISCEDGKASSLHDEGLTNLHLAALNGHEALAKLLLQRDESKLNLRDSNGCTPLHWAAKYGYEEVVKVLLTEGKAEVDSEYVQKQTPLLRTTETGHEAGMDLPLGTSKIEVDAKNTYGKTPLSLAARNGHEAVVKLLLNMDKVDINLLLIKAVRRRRLSVAKLLLETENFDLKQITYKNAFDDACANGHVDVMELLLRTGRVDVNSTNRHGYTPLSEAIQEGRASVVQLLLDHDEVDLNLQDDKGRTALHRASSKRKTDMVTLLLGTGNVDVNLKDGFGKTSLHMAADRGHASVVQLLSANDEVDLNLQDAWGWTALHYASSRVKESVVELLLDTEKSEVNLKNCQGETALQIASQYGNKNVVKLLLEKGKIDVDVKNDRGETALHLASRKGNRDVVQLLLEAGKSEIHLKNNLGQTALHLACGRPRRSNILVHLLLERSKAEVDVQDKSGTTALHYASYYGNTHLVYLLLEMGKAEVNLKNTRGLTALQLASRRGHQEVVKLLQHHARLR
ncbi:hypothetical protein EPUS_03001 [Endocarpon pusillum Z07020]|uniref:Uncharacterized protein n=1 Tax=Endocarpon pusillum (strain Z07020 / HMAS-L-300199) TaxID=1263415 RepID=U1HRP4_ENDPU|nr:uncharacterized protein EPUS_03001 [Endocarpon pusillum Z07020]ERF73160.1 hypothetical protein EPUS_03001 [Endocarpon pusillum Z07020]